jgi:hypothetical protein
MKTIAICIVLLLSTALAHAQEEFNPAIVILSPNTTVADDRYDTEIEMSQRRIQRNIKERLQLERQFRRSMKEEPKNERIMAGKDRAFMRTITFYRNVSFIMQQYLQYKLLERFPNVLIYAKRQTSSGDSSELASIAGSDNVRFVINPLEVNSYVEKEKKYTKIRLQVFDKMLGKIVLDREYTGNDRNPGSDFTCDEGSIDCTVNNALIKGINDINRIILARTPAPAQPPAKK